MSEILPIRFGDINILHSPKIKKEKHERKAKQAELILQGGYVKPTAIELCEECRPKFTNKVYYIYDIYRLICEGCRNRFKEYADSSGEMIIGGMVKPIKELHSLTQYIYGDY